VQPELIADCVHCGFCLPTCPTYSLWHEEMDSPRGRIYLMQGLVDGSISLNETVVEHFDRCLGCMACVTACPSGVQYDKLIEQTRDHVERTRRRGGMDRLVRAGVFAVLPHRRRLRAAMRLRRLPAPGPLRSLKQIAPPWSSPEWPDEHLPGDGPSVAVVAGCVASVVFGDVNAATARVLHAEGYDVHVPHVQECCGALHAHAGRLDEGVARAHALERALDGHDYIVTNAAGCGSHLKDHGVANVVDVSELLVEPRAERQPLPLRVAFQDSCHLRHAQRLAAAPRGMLDAIPELERLEPAEQEICCGSAGIYNIVQPRVATELGDRKAVNVLAGRPDAYASGNPGCLVQVTAALRRAGRPLPAFHPIELVDASIRGMGVDELLGSARR
jgi:glycolate oxidase iron-sulfur subunit